MASRKISKAIKQDYAKERKEHPWASPAILRRIAKDHVKSHGSGERIIVERTVMVPMPSKKKKRSMPQQPWWNRLY